MAKDALIESRWEDAVEEIAQDAAPGARVRTYKYRANPTSEQVATLQAQLSCAWTLYNALLQERVDTYRVAERDSGRRRPWHHLDGDQRPKPIRLWSTDALRYEAIPAPKGLSANDQNKRIKEIPKGPGGYPKGMSKLVMIEVVQRVDRAFAAFFRRAKEGRGPAGYPQPRRQYNSLTFGLTGPSRPPPERDEEWLAEHDADLAKCTEYIVELGKTRRAAAVTAKELKELVGGSTGDARSLRVLALTDLGYEVPPGVTSGAGTYRDGVLKLTGVGEMRLEKHRPLPPDAIPRTATVLRSCGRWYVSISVELPPATPEIEDLPAVGLAAGVIQWFSAFTDSPEAAEGLAADLRRMAEAAATSDPGRVNPRDHRRRLWAAERHAKRLSAALERYARLGERPAYGCGAIRARRARQARRRHARVLFRLRQIEAKIAKLRKRIAAASTMAEVVPDEAGAAVLIEGAHAGPRHAKRVARTQRRMARRRKPGHAHSHRYKLARDQYARAKERERRLRTDHGHKASCALVGQFGEIYFEDLDIGKLTAAPGSEHAPETELPAHIKRRLDGGILDQAWGAFADVTAYKAADAGRKCAKKSAVGVAENCARCGRPVPKPMTLRVHHCPGCGYTALKVVNTPRNVLQRPLEQPGRAGPSGANGRGLPHAVV